MLKVCLVYQMPVTSGRGGGFGSQVWVAGLQVVPTAQVGQMGVHEQTGADSLQTVVDGARAQAAKFGADRTLPRTVVIDAHGVVKAVFLEEGDEFEEQLEKILRDSGA